MEIQCCNCKGIGWEIVKVYLTCSVCRGKGEAWNEIKQKGYWCFACGGDGYKKEERNKTCTYCQGEGFRTWIDDIKRPMSKGAAV